MKSDDQMHLVEKPQNFECVPSNLLGRLIQGSFGWGFVAKMHPKRSKFNWFINEQWIRKVLDFLVQDSQG